MLRKIINYHLVGRFKHYLMGRKFSQPYWEKLNTLSLLGMNINCDASFQESGELWVVNTIIKDSAQRSPIIFDVGANVGEYSSLILSRVPAARLYCFEPAQTTFKKLLNNLRQQQQAKLFNFGFGDREEIITLYSDAEASGLASVYRRRLDHRNITMNHQEEIHLKTLDGFCESQQITHIDLLKLDVEGHELKVLKGAQNLINSNAIDFIQFEFGGTDIDSRTFFQDFFYLLNPRYKIHRVLKDGLAPIEVYSESLEVFGYTNYLAISRTVAPV